MSSQSKINALALHEILLSISDSLNEAQHQLRNMPPYDEYGRPNTLYHLPYLDFSLEVISEGVQDTGVQNVSKLPAFLPAVYKRQLLYTIVEPGKEAVSKSKNKITSTISGRFVAVLPNDGMPQLFIGLSSSHLGNNKFRIKVMLQQAAGEPVAGQKIEVNFDRQSSEALNKQNLSNLPVFLGSKEGVTKNNGVFETDVDLNVNGYLKTFVFVANSGTIFTSIAIDKI